MKIMYFKSGHTEFENFNNNRVLIIILKFDQKLNNFKKIRLK